VLAAVSISEPSVSLTDGRLVQQVDAFTARDVLPLVKSAAAG